MMLRRFYEFVLRCRLENVMAVGVSVCLLALFFTTRLFRQFEFGLWDLLFILLPVGVLVVKALIGMLASGQNEVGADGGILDFFADFFRPFAGIVRDWFPFFLLTACYYSLFSNLVLRINTRPADETLSRIDAWMFGTQAAFILEPHIHPWITDLLETVYFSFVLCLPVTALYFYLKKEKAAFRRLMMGYLTLMLMGITSYVLVPAIGPEMYFADRFTRGLQGQAITRQMVHFIYSARVGHDCFPSLHVGIPLLISFYLRQYVKKAFVPALIYVALMCCATIYLRAHYVIDVIASFAYAPVAYWLNDLLLRHWPGERLIYTNSAN